VKKVRFKRKVMPGDTLRFETKILANKRKNLENLILKAFRGSEMVCSAEILCADGSFK
jgi:3-hydroxymyristoyl/3-hydroxydecanoyl-(acyl carrier protein) dehydratases